MPKTSDALEILYADIGNDAEMLELIHNARVQGECGMVAYKLREEARLSQDELGVKVGHAATWVEDLEMGDFNGDSLEALQEVARVLGAKIDADVKRIEKIEQQKKSVAV